ncbi:MAG: putative major capsid protein [Prokaryotic dsDNA virus sp.]|nr:MAG: putative major capsid protein [Prokaryotic dsDNA virus sp.]|tara:strand:+ start:14784 stop:15800 length:1017 start_codon:yes stop_codon:yes gene_type:complete
MASSYSNIHPVDQVLTSLAVEAIPSDSQLIADQIFEKVNIPERSGTLLIENTRNFMGSPDLDLERAPGASRPMIGSFDRTNLTYKAKIYSASDSIAMEDIEDSQYPGSEEARIIRKVARTMKLAKEKRAADLLFTAANFAAGSKSDADAITGGAGVKFNAAGAEPLSDLHIVKDLVFANSHGINPDTLILGREVFRELARNPEMRGYVGDATKGIASGNLLLNDQAIIQVLQNVLGIPNVYVGAARRETAVPGATSSESYIWTGDQIFMGIMKGSDAIVSKTGNVKAMPVTALDFEYKDMIAGQYDSLDLIRRYVWAEQVNQFKMVDSSFGFLVTDCL